ncbi:MAG: alpha-ketoacid dehydrogenase subunit beta [Candidatus Latescibacterota bacterium]|nr:MAG: alpha-ketoacid dehydrogenase subunit beta [Candidatus Latescibacterota bacterium]
MRETAYTQALSEVLSEEMERDEAVFLIGEDIGAFGGVFGITKGFVERFGERRVRQTPICESAMIGTAVGAAMTGLRPVAEIMYVDFVTVAMDQIANQAAKLRYMSGGQVTMPLVIRTQGGDGSAEAAQHSQSLEAWFVHVPGLKVVMPATPYDAKGLLKAAIRDDNPVMFIEHKLLYSEKQTVPEGEWLVPLGEAEVKSEGDDITVVATSLMVHRTLKAAEALSGEISVEVIDPRTLVPLDIEAILKSVEKTGRLLVVHEACTRAGIGAEIVREIVEKAFDYLDAPPKVLGGLNIPMPYTPPLEKAVTPQEEDIIKAVREMV